MEYLWLAIVIYLSSYVFYYLLTKGLDNKAKYLQMRRFVASALLAVLPSYIGGMHIVTPVFGLICVVGYLWMITYPLLYWISNHRTSREFSYHHDFSFGMYIIGWFSSLLLLAQYFPAASVVSGSLITILELAILMIPLTQWGYFILYGSCINENGMRMLQETHYNEIIEFFKSVGLIFNGIVVLGTGALVYLLAYFNIGFISAGNELEFYRLTMIAIAAIFMTMLLWSKKNHSIFLRTGIVEFYLDIQDFLNKDKEYRQNREDSLKSLKVECLGEKIDEPHTFILVIGESESRDYMHAFVENYQFENTPWLSKCKQKRNFLLFPNAFSTCANTVEALSRALTEFNQYDEGAFYSSCSIVDIFHKLGYKVHWYSNQGHLGAADTPVTLVAETADVAKWTKQELNKVQYDESLFEYLQEVDPQSNNLLVVHLKGSHFSYLNRYPEGFCKFGKPGVYDLIPNYLNTVAYTDYILQQIFEYGKNNLNLQAMIYFSDHAAIPDKRRSPNFEGMGLVRIPLFVYMSDEYISKHQKVYNNLFNHQDTYWTNDLAYELICGILDIKSNKYKEENSLASVRYRFNVGNLLTNLGKTRLIDKV